METFEQEQPAEMPEACATTPMGRAIRLIGDAWILLIFINLLRGPKRFNELRAFMGHISSRTLTQRLRTLEEMGFVQRRAFLTRARRANGGRGVGQIGVAVLEADTVERDSKPIWGPGESEPTTFMCCCNGVGHPNNVCTKE